MTTMTATAVTYRILPADEWERLGPIVAPYGPLPAPEASAAAVAERDGEIVGVLFLQLAWHMEPLVIEDPRVNFLRLKGTLDEALREHDVPYFAFTEDEHVARIAELAGLTRSTATVWEGSTGGRT